MNCTKKLCSSVPFLLHFPPSCAIPIEMGTIPGQGQWASSGTAQKHHCKTHSEQYQKLQRAPYGKYGATAHICACLFWSFVRHPGGARLGEPLFVQAKRLPLLPLPCRQPQGFVLEAYQPPRAGEQPHGFPGQQLRMVFAALGINSSGIEEMLSSSRSSSTRPPGRTAGTTGHRGAAALG